MITGHKKRRYDESSEEYKRNIKKGVSTPSGEKKKTNKRSPHYETTDSISTRKRSKGEPLSEKENFLILFEKCCQITNGAEFDVYFRKLKDDSPLLADDEKLFFSCFEILFNFDNKNARIENCNTLFKWLLIYIQKLDSEKANRILSYRIDYNVLLGQALFRNNEGVIYKLLTVFKNPQYASSLKVNLDYRTQSGFMSLQTAIKSGNEKIVDTLLTLLKKPEHANSLRLNLENLTKNGIMPLNSALISGNEKIANALLTLLQEPEHANSLKLNLENLKGGFTPLNSALKSGNEKIADALLILLQKPEHANSLRLNLENWAKDGFTPLECALKSGNEKIANAMLTLLQKPEYADLLRLNLENYTKYGFTPLECALTSGNEKIVDAFLTLIQKPEHVNLLSVYLEKLTKDDFAPLSSALKSGNEKIANAMLTLLQKPEYAKSLRLNLGNRTKDGFVPLNNALRSGNEKIVDELLILLQKPEHADLLRLNLENYTKYGFTPLESALTSGNEKITNALLTLLQNPEHANLLKLNLGNRTKDDYAPLNSALNSGNEKIANALLTLLQHPERANLLRLNLENRTKEGFTPLNHALASGNEKIVDELLTLLQKPAHVTSLRLNLENRTNDGFAPLSSALKSGNEKIVDALLILLQKPEHVDALKINLSNCTEAGFTPLQSALKNNKIGIIKKIIFISEKFLNPQEWCSILLARNNLGYSLLDTVVIRGDITFVKIYLAALARAFGQDARYKLRDLIRRKKYIADVNKEQDKMFVELLEKCQQSFPLEYFAKLEDENQQSNENPQNHNLTDKENFLVFFKKCCQITDETESNTLCNKLISFFDDSYPLTDDEKFFFSCFKNLFHVANKNTNIENHATLFKWLLSHIQKLDTEKVNRILSYKIDDKYMLLGQALFRNNEGIIDELLTVFKNHQYAPSLKVNLDYCTQAGFMPLHAAIKSGNDKVVHALLNLLQKPEHANSLRLNLENRTNDGFMPLNNALNSGNEKITNSLLSLLQEPEHFNSLRLNLENRTKDRFTPLISALKSGNEKIVDAFLTLLQQPELTDLVKLNLDTLTKDGFTPLETALSSGNEIIVYTLLTLLQKPEHANSLRLNLENRTNDGFMPLQIPIKPGNEKIVDVLLTLLQKPEHANSLRLNLENRTNDGFMPLDSALKSGNEKFVDAFLILLQQPEHVDSLKLNLENRTKNDFMPLNSALNSGNEKIVDTLLNLLQQPKRVDSLRLNLENRTNDGFMPLNCALKSGNEKIVDALLILFQKPEHANSLRLNLENRTNDGFTLLESALITGNEKIVDTLLNLLQKPEHGNSLRLNLENCTKNNFMPLNSALNYSTEKIVIALLTFLQKPKHADLLKLNLENRTKEGFLPLNSAITSCNEKIIDALLILLERTEHVNARKMNLNNYTEAGFTPLQSAFKISKIEIIRKIIFLSEKFLNPQEWCSILLARNSLGYSLLDTVVIRGDITLIKIYLATLARAFGSNAQFELRTLVRQKKYILGRGENHDTILEFLKKCQQDFPLAYFAKLEDKNQESDKDTRNNKLTDQAQEQHLAADPHFKHTVITQPAPQKPFSLTFKIKAKAPPPSPASANSLIVPPFAGINAKYLDENPVRIPKVLSQSLPTNLNRQSHALVPFGSSCAPRAGAIEAFSIKEDLYFQGTHYTKRGSVSPTDKITFVCAGRKEKALIPQPQKGRCIIICTFDELKQYRKLKQLLNNADILVLENLCHPTEGNYPNLGLISTRRLGVFLAAQHWKLNNFLMIDDNLLHVDYASNTASNSWDGFYQLLENQLKNEPCVTVTRQFAPPPQPGQLGSKLFMIDLEKIRKALLIPTEDLFLLFFDPKFASYWGEDYYLQIMLHYLFQPQAQGFRTLDQQVASLTRAQKNPHAFLSSGNGNRTLAQPLPTSPSVTNLSSSHAKLKRDTFDRFNLIISQNQARYQQQKALATTIEPAPALPTQRPEEVERTSTSDCMQAREPSEPIAKRFKVETQENQIPGPLKFKFIWKDKGRLENEFEVTQTQNIILPTEKLAPRDFVSQLKEALKQVDNAALRTYQVKALHHLGMHSNRFAGITMATGTGKSRVQGEAARLAYQSLKEGECIVFVTANIALVTQLFEEFKKQQSENNQGVPVEDIIPISSAHIPINSLLKNFNQVEMTKKVFVFCNESLKHLLEKYPDFLSRVRLFLMDEYHDYALDVEEIVRKARAHPDLLVVGCTATPPSKTSLAPVFEYSHIQGVKEKVLAPVIVDSLGKSFSLQNVKALINTLPLLLEKWYHPGYKDKTTLDSTKGIIFLPSIELCEKAYEHLKQHHFECYMIHSNNPRRHAQMAQFKQSTQGILLACDMCKLGFDHNELAFAILAQKVEDMAALKQILGRVMRKDKNKVGYLLAFKDTCDKMKSLLAMQPMTLPLDPDYLGQDEEDNDNVVDGIPFKIKTFKYRTREISPQVSEPCYKEEMLKYWLGEELWYKYGYKKYADELYECEFAKEELEDMIDFLKEEEIHPVHVAPSTDEFDRIKKINIKKK